VTAANSHHHTAHSEHQDPGHMHTNSVITELSTKNTCCSRYYNCDTMDIEVTRSKTTGKRKNYKVNRLNEHEIQTWINTKTEFIESTSSI